MKLTKPPFIKLFDFELYNIEEFVHTGFDEINPILEEKRYFNYWEDHLFKIMNGMWGRDYDKKRDLGGYRFMPGDLYHFTKFFKMRIEETGVASNVLENPKLRDLDWWSHYNSIVADGYSGMKDDKVHTSHRFAKDHESFKELMGYEKVLLDMYADDILDKYGKFKKYVDPIQYLHMTHKEPMGVPLMQNEKQNLIWFAARRIGKTYFCINRVQRGMITNGAKTIEEYYSKRTKFTSILGSHGDKYTKEHLTKFFDSYNELANIGAYRKDGLNFEGAFWAPLTGSRELSKYVTNLNKEDGGKKDVLWGSQIHRFSFENDPNAAVGVASDFALMDEIGLWDNLEHVDSETSPTQKRETRFGNSFYTGTGGNVTKVLKTKKAFMNPAIIEAMVFKDYCNPANDKGCGMFAPVQYTKNIYRNENGNIDLVSAYNDELKIREEKLKKGIGVYIKHVAAYCMTYNDIFLQSSSGVLPVDRASEALERFTNIPVRERPQVHAIGRIKRPDNLKEEVYFEKDDNVNPISNYDDYDKADDVQKSGIVVVYEPPDLTGNSMYMTTYDSVKDHTGVSAVIAASWKIFGPGGVRLNLVGECVYRRVLPKDNDNVAINMNFYWPGTLCPETNIPHILTYMAELGFYNYLHDTPKLAISTLLKQAEKYDKGVYKSPGMEEDVPNVTAELLMTAVEVIDQEDGTKKEIWMVDEIPSEYLLNDIIYWSLDGNFDFMANLFIFALCIKEMKIRKEFNKPKEGNDLYKQIQEAIRDESNISQETDELYEY